jgi:hypothetical protein
VSGETIDLHSPLPEDLHRALVEAAAPDVDLTKVNPLEFFGFFDAHP